MTSDFLATLIRIRQNPYTSSLFNESPIFNDVRFLSDSGFLFSSKKTLCWGHPNILLHWIYIKKHMVVYENNKFRHDVHICQPGLISKAYWPVWKCAYMLWKWQHLAILQRCLDLNLLGKYFYAAYLYTRRLMGSTDQADPSCFYFRISWILMEWSWFYFFRPLHLVQGLRSNNIK